MNLKWYPGSELDYLNIRWMLLDDSVPKHESPFKAHIQCEIPIIPTDAVWHETKYTFVEVKRPEGITDDEFKALLVVEYRLLNVGNTP